MEKLKNSLYLWSAISLLMITTGIISYKNNTFVFGMSMFTLGFSTSTLILKILIYKQEQEEREEEKEET